MAQPKPAASKKTKSTVSRPDAGRSRGPSKSVEHEGATEAETGDRTGPGAGYDTEPEQVKDKGGVAST